MHRIQEKILKLMDTKDVSDLSLREIAIQIEEIGSPQKIKHHINQLAKKGLIKIDKRNNTIDKVKQGMSKDTGMVSLPILGSANCGEATCFAEEKIEGYLHVSKKILGDLTDKVKDLFVLRAVGSSMNQANVFGNAIENGDYVIVDKTKNFGKNNSYVVSVIDDVANIKRIYVNRKDKQIILSSESNQDIPPIYIHEEELQGYLIAGTVVKVMKKPKELANWENEALSDTLKSLGPMSNDEHNYYMNL
jgi:SOS-response transcriptional repressor LexA